MYDVAAAEWPYRLLAREDTFVSSLTQTGAGSVWGDG